MSRLGKRVERLEGGDSGGIDIVAKVPEHWSEERMSAEVEALAREHGHEGPFGLTVLIRQFNAREDDGAELICVRGEYLNR